MVLGLIYISEKNPKLGGLCSGLPLSVGIFVYFYAQENGLNFLISSMPYAIAGFSNALIFTIGFFFGGKLFIRSPFLNTLSAIIAGLIVYLISGYFITLLNLNMISSIFIFIISIFISIIFFLKIPHYSHDTVLIKKKYTLTNKILVIVFRVSFVSILVLFITGVAGLIGHKWAGILSSFPVMLVSVITVLIFSYKNQLYPNVLKHFSYGISILAIYDLLVFWLYPIIGINLGTAISYIISFFYLSLLNKLRF